MTAINSLFIEMNHDCIMGWCQRGNIIGRFEGQRLIFSYHFMELFDPQPPKINKFIVRAFSSWFSLDVTLLRKANPNN